MSLLTRAKRTTYLIHRYTGVAACVLMALWFASGIVMLFVGYPKLTPWERLGALPDLSGTSCCVSTEQALSYRDPSHHVADITLTSINGTPHFRIRQDNGVLYTVNATTGKLAPSITSAFAQDSASHYLSGAHATALGRVAEDRWTHSRGLDRHRPLWLFAMDDPDNTWLYVSSTTGEVVMDASNVQRTWNYVGAWLHWLYMFRDTPVDPVWSWIVIILSSVGVVSAVAGITVGIWRWRFQGTYKSGSKSPYQQPYLRWHHITGLLFSAIVLTWIVSGLASMNPFGVFDARHARPHHHAYMGSTPNQTYLTINAHDAITLLQTHDFTPRELSWRTLNRQPFILAKDARNNTRLIVEDNGAVQVKTQWPAATLQQAARHLLPAAITSIATLTQDDAYYYVRQSESMMGANERRLPALKVDFDDPGHTRVYIDMHTGDLALSLDQSQRVGRWLFNFLHSWDLPVMLKTGWLRDMVLILFSLGGLALSMTGVVIGISRVKLWVGKLKR